MNKRKAQSLLASAASVVKRAEKAARDASESKSPKFDSNKTVRF